ncbi:MAG TPA: CBS domain-containing protein [Nitrososphaeraceae archaeon]|nr:CBS domain-containing protein [Nitrososphaeraceae archaeon]
MKVSDVMADKVPSLNSEDTVAKALSMMHENNINQISIVDDNGGYLGMIYAKEFLGINTVPSSKLKNFLTKTPILSPEDNIERCTQLVVETGNHALPVVENGKFSGIVSDKDVISTADFGHAIVDEVMSGAIVIEENSTLSNALSKMRRYDISRLPVINSNGVLTGVINSLDVSKIIATPRERASKSPGVGTLAAIRDVKVKDIMRRAISVERGTKLNSIIESFRRNDEIIVVGDTRPIGIVTIKDALELILPKREETKIQVAHIDNEETRQEIEEYMTRFLKKIQGKLENVQHVIIYADKHKTRKYSIRARVSTGKGIIDAKAVGYDALSACKELVSRLDRRIKSKHSQKIRDRQHGQSGRQNT